MLMLIDRLSQSGQIQHLLSNLQALVEVIDIIRIPFTFRERVTSSCRYPHLQIRFFVPIYFLPQTKLTYSYRDFLRNNYCYSLN
jgi:hypothetical protein